MSKVSVRKFTDYRSFLLAYVQDEKKSNPNWTYGVWARRLGLKDVSSITKIIQGKRDPGESITHKLIDYFQFKPKDAQYFRDLVALNKIKNDPRLSALLLEKIGRDHSSVSRLLEDQFFTLISNWYCLAIREMVRLDEFFEDPEWISKKLIFKTTPRECSRAIDLLLEVGLLKRNERRELEIADGRYHTKNDIRSEAIVRYHESMLENAKIAQRKVHVDHRDFQASIITTKYDKIPLIKEKIREFKDEFCRVIESEPGDGTFQLQIQFFPLTKKEPTSTTN